MKKAAQQVGQASSLPVALASLPAVAVNPRNSQQELSDGVISKIG